MQQQYKERPPSYRNWVFDQPAMAQAYQAGLAGPAVINAPVQRGAGVGAIGPQGPTRPWEPTGFQSPWMGQVAQPAGAQDAQAVQAAQAAQAAEAAAAAAQGSSNDEPQFVDPDLIERQRVLGLLGQSDTRYNDLLAQQKALPQNDAYSDTLKNALARTQGREGQLNLAPLAGLSDMWFGGNQAQTYQNLQPFTEQAKEQQVASLQNALAKRQGDMTIEQRKSIENALGKEAYLQQVLGGQLKAAGSKGLTPGENIRKEQQVDARMNRYSDKQGKSIKNMTAIAQSSGNLRELLRKNGGKIPDVSSKDYTRFNSEVSYLVTSYNMVAELGALSGGDLELLLQRIGKGDSIASTELSDFFRRGGMDAALEEVQNTLDKQMNVYRNEIPLQYRGDADKLFDNDLSAYQTARGLGSKNTKGQTLSPEATGMRAKIEADYAKSGSKIPIDQWVKGKALMEKNRSK